MATIIFFLIPLKEIKGEMKRDLGENKGKKRKKEMKD